MDHTAEPGLPADEPHTPADPGPGLPVPGRTVDKMLAVAVEVLETSVKSFRPVLASILEAVYQSGRADEAARQTKTKPTCRCARSLPQGTSVGRSIDGFRMDFESPEAEAKFADKVVDQLKTLDDRRPSARSA